VIAVAYIAKACVAINNVDQAQGRKVSRDNLSHGHKISSRSSVMAATAISGSVRATRLMNTINNFGMKYLRRFNFSRGILGR
jgi:hypothetical protein